MGADARITRGQENAKPWKWYEDQVRCTPSRARLSRMHDGRGDLRPPVLTLRASCLSDFPELREFVQQYALDCRHCSAFSWCGEPALLRWGQCISAGGEPRKRPHCLMCLGYGETKTFKIKNALFRECWTRTLRVTASPTRVSLGVASCQSEILSLKKAVWRLWLVSKSRTMRSAEGCEQLLRRVASVARPPSSPSHARTALSRTICGRI